jgi:hypothetical protein
MDQESASRLDPLTCSLRLRFGLLYLSRKVAYLQGKAFATYRRVTLNYAHVSVPVSVRQLPTELKPATFRATIPINHIVWYFDRGRVRHPTPTNEITEADTELLPRAAVHAAVPLQTLAPICDPSS